MAVSTYAEALAEVASVLARDDLTANIPNWFAYAEAEINRRLRVREMEFSADLTVSGQTVALPDDFGELRRLYLSADPIAEPDYMAPELFWGTYVTSTSGVPRHFTIEGDSLVFGPVPDATYTGKLLYWRRLDLTAAAHALFTRNPDLYVYGALKHSAPFVGDDPRLATWSTIFEAALETVRLADAKRIGTARTSRTMYQTP